MRKWFLPVTLLGLGGLGCVFFLTARGREAVGWLDRNLRDAENLTGWNDAAQHELERIQSALDRVAAVLESAPQRERPA